MFTGLIEEVGRVATVESTPEGSRIVVNARTVLEGVRLGDSIAMDGACMTVVAFNADTFTVEASPESLRKTNFARFRPGSRINLERPLTAASRIGGHYVTGHVDGQAALLAKEPQGNSWILTFELPTEDLAELLVPKGSIAVLGISLTVNTVEGRRFSVAIIPHTLAHTNLDDYQVGDCVNIETDLLGKYTRRLLFARSEPSFAAESLLQVQDLALAPAMRATLKTPAAAGGMNIRSGGWFNHDAE